MENAVSSPRNMYEIDDASAKSRARISLENLPIEEDL